MKPIEILNIIDTEASYISVSFSNAPNPKLYTYKAENANESWIGSIVIVPTSTSSKPKVAWVRKICDPIELDTEITYSWIFTHLDTTRQAELTARDFYILKKIKAKQHEKIRESVAATFASDINLSLSETISQETTSQEITSNA